MFASRFSRVCGWLILLLAAPIAVLYGTPQRRHSINSAILKTVTPRAVAVSKPAASAIRPVAVHAALQGAPYLSLRDGQAVSANYVGDSSAAGLLRSNAAQPLALASADFDSDGVPDLVAGYAAGNGGVISIHRGNIDALWPYGAALRNGEPPAFLPNALALNVPEPPDFIGVGDFDADGHWDIMTAHLGSNSMYLLRGDGHGNFGSPQRISLSGNITAFTTGEINRADGLTDIVVGITNANGSQALVFESPTGAANATPESFSLPAPATSMVLGMIEGGPMQDLAIGAGNQLVVVHGRDRRLSLGDAARSTVASANVTHQILPFAVKALALGHFSDTAGLAALGDDGAIHLMQNFSAVSQAIMQLSNSAIAQPVSAIHGGSASSSKPLRASGIGAARAAEQATLLQTMRQSLTGNTSEWKIQSTIAAPATAASNSASLAHQFVSAHVSSSKYDDLLLLDNQASQVHVLSSRTTRVTNAAAGVLAKTVSQPMSLAASLDVTGSPAAVLPMRVNQHGLKSLVMLQTGQSAPVIAQQTPSNVFTVTNTLDITTSSLTAPIPPGSLRQALIDAQNSGGTAEIVFNIPTSDPGFNATTGVFLIQPLSTVPPGNDDDFALPPSSETVTIDGYTQPGASANTLVSGDNAKLLIQIDGGKALTPGGTALQIFDTVGAVIRGFIVTNWNRTDTSSASNPTGGIGLEDSGASDFVEGNFVGVDASGLTAGPNTEGVNVSSGGIIGTDGGGDIFGGTTPQARNIVSGNSGEGIVAEPGANFLQIQGNFFGTDRTGKISVPNFGDGVFVPAPLVTVGGALPGAGNLISGNSNYNLDIGNGFPNHSAQNVTVQGNIIGPDVTGTVTMNSFASGVGIVNEASNITVGGTTPLARNVISGNNFLGVEIADDSFNVVVQGNFIGLDITGTKSLGNGSGLTGENNIPSGGIAIDTHSFLPPGTPVLAPPFNNAIGGAVAGAGNVISGNNGDGISIMGFDNNDPNGFNPTNLSNFVMGNFVGSDVSGLNAVPNSQNGLHLLMDAEANSPAMNNAIGGSAGGAGNLFAFNTMNGVLIEGTSSKNPIIGNTIQHNGGSGVRIVTGTGNTISRNSIFGNGALGIDLGSAGPNANSNCQTTATGANNSQNAPVLTAGSGATFVSATATDPNGNTSEFSNVVAASLSGNILTLTGNFNSLPSTAYTIEFFSSPSADPSGFGQGQTFVASSSVTTASTCAVPIINPVDLADADVSVAMTFKSTVPDQVSSLAPGPDFGDQVYTAVVTNNGAATAHNVVLTDPLPATLQVSSTYCNLPTCQSPITTTVGGCTVSANTVTCNLGTLTVGQSVTVRIPVQALAIGSITNTVSVTATETDPIPANNTASLTLTSQNPFTQILQITPPNLLTSSPDTQVIIGGTVFLPGVSVVTFTDANNVSTVLPVTAFFDNQTCGFNSNVSTAMYCQELQVTLPHALIGTAGAASFTVTNPGQAFTVGPQTFTLANTCTFSAPFAFTNIDSGGTNLIPTELDTLPNVSSCTTTVSSDSPWIVPLAPPALDQFNEIEVDIAFAPNSGAQRTGNVTFAGQTIMFTQAAGDNTVCTYTLSPPSATLSSVAGNYSVLVTPSSQSCSYFVGSFAPFATVAADSGLLGGTATVHYSVTANTGGPQTGDLLIGPVAFPITQNPASTCFFTLSSNSANFPTNASTGSVNVIASLPTCPWTATNNSPSFVNITSGASGTGNGTIQYSVAQNSGGGRNAIITVANTAGASVQQSITQASVTACSATLSPATFNAPAEGASTGFLINLSLDQCSWNAVSNNPTDLAITSANFGTGSQAAITFALAQNPGTSPRTLTITAGCQTFTVIQAGAGASNPVPTVTTLSPTNVAAGSGAFTLTVNGTGFVNGATVSFGGANKTTSFVSATQVTASILAADVASAGTPAVVVTNPTPGGGASNSVNFSVTGVSNPVPTITTLSPTGVTAGSGALTLTVNGTNFISNSVVNFGGSPRTTTFVSATQVTAAILAGDVTTVGTPAVTVTNPTPGGGTSNSVNFNISAAANPVPTITSLVPNSVTAGGAAFSLIVNGTNLISTSVVNFNGSPRVTTFVSGGQVTAAITAADIATAGTASITVTNPAPGGGTSAAATLTINNPVPTVTTLSPTSGLAGGAGFTLTVNGTGFVSSSVVNFNHIARTTTFVNATQVTAAILASDIATSGSFLVTVTNPAPGGGTSTNNVTFQVNNPVPTITTLSPTGIAAGSAAFTLTINGTNFISGASTVSFGGQPHGGTVLSSTQMTIQVLPIDVATVGTPAVIVTNAAPGGGASNTVNFNVTAATNPVPTVTTISPTSIAVGSIAFTLTVNGTNFVSNSTVNFNGAPKVTTFVSATQLTAQIQSLDVSVAGTPAVTVTNPTPGGGTSNSVTFTITAANNPAPTISSLSPTGVTAGSGALTLTVNGTNFISNSVVNFAGSPRTTTFVSATQVTAAILAGDVTTVGTPAITVTNPTPGGGTSNSVNFNISVANNPVPTVTTLSPTSVIAGSGAFTLTVNGTNFLNTSVVNFGGAARTTTFVSATQLTAAILAGDVAGAGTPSVTVTNPAPGGGTSNVVTFTVTAAPNPVPAITSLSPNTTSAGTGAFTLTINGSNFISSSVVQWNGTARTTTFVNVGQLTAAITAADVQTANLDSVSVFNPTPGGGTSNALTLTVTTPIPSLSTLVPNSAIAGGAAFPLTVNGSNFINTSVVQWNGSNRTTTFVSSTQLTAAITAADIATAGTASVKVFTPTVVFSGAQPLGVPAGTTSNALTFTITAANPVPTLTSISPTTTGAGGAAFTLTLTGTNFISSSVAQWKGSPRTTTFVSATQLTAAITAADIATSGTAAITVVNPTPGGGTSNALTFTITDFSVSATTTTQTVTAGQSGNYTIATATVGGAFPGSVTFTASGLPTGASASFNPTSVSAGTSTTMTITTTSRGLAQITAPPFSPHIPTKPLLLVAFATLFALTTISLAKFGKRAAKRLVPIAAFALLLISVGYISGCSGGGFPKVGSNTGTPAGTYTITVTGTSGADVHTTTVTLVVQ